MTSPDIKHESPVPLTCPPSCGGLSQSLDGWRREQSPELQQLCGKVTPLRCTHPVHHGPWRQKMGGRNIRPVNAVSSSPTPYTRCYAQHYKRYSSIPNHHYAGILTGRPRKRTTLPPTKNRRRKEDKSPVPRTPAPGRRGLSQDSVECRDFPLEFRWIS